MELKCLGEECNVDLLLSQRVIFTMEGEGKQNSKKLTVPGEILKLEKDQFNTIVEVTSEMS